MGTDSDRPKHNPDIENLKSLLKRPNTREEKRSHRVVFNENKNEFFDADYIILIREECDYDDEDDDGVCTCHQHELVRLRCCETNCNCSIYENHEQTAPQSPKFAPPLEFVDAVTLSPPDGYKDMELDKQQLYALQQINNMKLKKRAVCRECSSTYDEDNDIVSQEDEGSHYDEYDEFDDKEQTDQSQQTTPTTPDSFKSESNLHDFLINRPSMILNEDKDNQAINPSAGLPVSGILKGGKMWKQCSTENEVCNKTDESEEFQQATDSSITSDEESNTKRIVRFTECDKKNQRESCDGASFDQEKIEEKVETPITNKTDSPESKEMMLTFKLGNHVLISNNSLKPNSAVRQLFPSSKPPMGINEKSNQQHLVTSDSLKAFEEANRLELPQVMRSGETDESIEKRIERNTLRRSLIRYEPKSRKNKQKTDNSLVERIKQLTCDVHYDEQMIDTRASPTGEEAENVPEAGVMKQDNSFLPQSAGTINSNSSSVSSTYRKITDLFTKKNEKSMEPQKNPVNCAQDIKPSPPDLGNGQQISELNHIPHAKMNLSTNDSRKQFLSSFVPLSACVGGNFSNNDDYCYQMNLEDEGGRTSISSTCSTRYSFEDIDKALKNDHDESKIITPDVLAGTPLASESGDELATFVQRDAGRTERIKKKYQPGSKRGEEEDDEHDDYGFNKRPSVRGIEQRFGTTTTHIVQQIQNHMEPVETQRVFWPYYSETSFANVDQSKIEHTNHDFVGHPQNYSENVGYPVFYKQNPVSEGNIHQSGHLCEKVYKMNGNSNYQMNHQGSIKCNDYHQAILRQKNNGRPLSPPPLEMSKTYHQTMVYIPYNYIETYQRIPSNTYYQQNESVKLSNQNQMNKRYTEPMYQQRIPMQVENHYKQTVRLPYQVNRSESPQFSTARATQTPAPNCNYYRYNRPIVNSVCKTDRNYTTNSMNRHCFPACFIYQSDTATDMEKNPNIPNGYAKANFSSQRDISDSPSKTKFTERGVPEGAASVSPPDTKKSMNISESPTSPQNSPVQNQKSMFYAMNV